MKTQQKDIAPGTLCCFSYENTTKSNDRKDMFVDDSFVPMYDMEISVYYLNSDQKYNYAKGRMYIPTAKFLYVKRHDKAPDPLFDTVTKSDFGWLHDGPLDHGHVVLFYEQLVYISDMSMHYMDLYIVPAAE